MTKQEYIKLTKEIKETLKEANLAIEKIKLDLLQGEGFTLKEYLEAQKQYG